MNRTPRRHDSTPAQLTAGAERTNLGEHIVYAYVAQQILDEFVVFARDERELKGEI